MKAISSKVNASFLLANREAYEWLVEKIQLMDLQTDTSDSVPIPWWLSDAVKSSGGKLIVFLTLSNLCQKAKWLRETARRIVDFIVLHHCPFDVVPTVAFAAPECPPVADVVINLRTVRAEHIVAHRFVVNNTVLPIPLAVPMNQLSRRDARQALGIPDNQVVLLSVGRAEKYRPCGSYDFVATVGKILDRHSCAHLYVADESVAAIRPYLCCPLHERLHFMGSIEEPVVYFMAADVYLESFPFGSGTALLEATLSGFPVVPAYAPLFPLLVANDDDAQHDILSNSLNGEGYINQIGLLIRRLDQRAKLGKVLKNRLLVDHTTEGWLKRLFTIYDKTDNLIHNPQPIPITHCGTMGTNIGLSQWHVMADGKNYAAGACVEHLKAVFRYAAFVAKDVGDYASAQRYAWRAISYDLLRWASWRLFGIVLMGKTGPCIRRIMSYV